jgi:RND family efflux transporter MFP subunit
MQGRLSASVWIAAGAALLLAGCGREADATAEPAVEAPPPLVQVISVAPTAASQSVRASGLLAYKRETPLAFGAPGEIESILVDEGDRVVEGQLLATLRRTTVGADAEEAAIARLTAEQQLARVQTLFDRGFASQAALDNAKLAVQRARDGAALRAPAPGVILRREAEPAQIVNAAQPLLFLGETRYGMVVAASVSAADIAGVKAGDAATVLVDGVERAGQVARIAPKSADATGAFEVEVAVASPGGLRSGQVAEVLIAKAAGGEAPAAFIVPALSLIDARADQGMVFVVDEQGVARRRAIETGGLTNAGVVVLKGLSPGDRVISAGAATVRDGQRVRVAQ